MKKIMTLVAAFLFVAINAQETANRFFYELTFKPKQDSARLEKVMTTLDISKDKSIYQDFTVSAQDSILKAEVEEMQRAGVWKDISKSIEMPKFSFKIIKKYPEMSVEYVDMMSMKTFSYDDAAVMTWSIQPEKQKIGEYNTQKATTTFGGRDWTAWFASDIPFQDGPYKFRGLPGLIVKVEDNGHNYSWTLKGNENVEDYKELSYAESLNQRFGMNYTPVKITKEKFDKAYKNFKADPFAEMRPHLSPEVMKRKMPGSNTTIGDMIRDQEKRLDKFFKSNDNPIEIVEGKTK